MATKKILLLTDFSNTSARAIEFTLQLYKGMACRFTVLNCYIELPLSTDQVDEVVDHNAQTRINDYVEGLGARSGSDEFSFTGKAVGGNLAVAVTSLYERDPFDIVVAGASGAGNSVRLGSVATEIIRAARYPVLVVPGAVPTSPISNIVIATDYRNFDSPELFESVRELLQSGSRELAFLRILDSDSVATPANPEKKALLDAYFEEFNPRHEEVTNDSPAEGIEAFLAAHPTGLLVTVSHHHSLWDVLLNRSTSRILAYEARVPLLVLSENFSDSPDDLPAPDWDVII